MSLATRCSACGTVFRVVQDQLKVSDGWVRCGRCYTVFSALDGLFTLHNDASPGGPVAALLEYPEQPKSADEPAATGATASPSATSATSATPSLSATATNLLEQPPAARLTESAEADPLGHTNDSQPFGPQLVAPSLADMPPRTGSVTTGGAALAEPYLSPPLVGESGVDQPPIFTDEPAPAPDFIRNAERQARWQRSGNRVALAFGVVALSIGLGAQALHHFRDLGAARWPVLRPVLGAWCAATGCRVQPPRRIDDISVEATTLTRAAGGPDAFRLGVTLRNRGALVVAMPAIDLSLTEIGGRLVARRVLIPPELQAGAALPAGAEAALQVLLATGSTKVAGYTVEIFYP